MQRYEEGIDRYAPQPFRGQKTQENEPLDRESQQFVHGTKNLFESMDFEEIESVMWRKVRVIIYIYFNTLLIVPFCLLSSINYVDFSKTEGPGGRTREEPLLESGYLSLALVLLLVG